MSTLNVTNFLVDADSKIIDCLNVINKNEKGIAFVCRDGKLLGSISDGDIRRALISGFTLESEVLEIANLFPIYGTVSESPSELQLKLQHGIEYLPVISKEGLLVKILTKDFLDFIPLAKPSLTQRESELVNEVMASGWIYSVGAYVGEFEEKFANFIGSEHAVAVSNGTQAIALALYAHSIGLGDEVIVPALTFGATVNAVIQVGATPVFIDVELDTHAIDVTQIRNLVTKNTKAILVVHLYGQSARLKEILSIAKDLNLLVIEDCAEAIGTYCEDFHVGSKSDAGTFSFFANKSITTGEGGMVTFNSRRIAERARTIRSHGFNSNNRYWHEEWGTNMRLTNLQAAIGVAQMERIDWLLASRKRVAQEYKENIQRLELENIVLPTEFAWSTNSHWLFTLRVLNSKNIQSLVDHFMSNRIEARRIFSPLPGQPAFSKYNTQHSKFPVAQEIFDSGICLPTFADLSSQSVKRISMVLGEFFSKKNVEWSSPLK